MSEPKHPITICLMILVFFILTIAATLRYNGNESQVQKIDSQFYALVNFITKQSLHLTFSKDKKRDLLNVKEAGQIKENSRDNHFNQGQDGEEQFNLIEDDNHHFRYINLFKNEDGWHLILQNREQILLEKHW